MARETNSGTNATMAETSDATLTGAAGTAEYVALHASERPEAVALIEDGRAITYAQFSRDIGKFAMALRDLSLPRGSTVVVECRNLYTHWLLLLAFEQLNVVTASIDPKENSATYAELLASAELVLSDADLGHVAAKRQIAITPAWVRDSLARGSAEGTFREQQSPGDIVRILRTSGTTGRVKRIAFSRRIHELRTVSYGERYRFTRESRYLLTLPFCLGLPYGCATACLRAGGCVVKYAGEDVGVLAKYGITHITLLPHNLKAALDSLPAGFIKPANLTISTSGSALSDELAERALSSLATEVIDNFGSNEAGGISFKRASLRDGFAPVCRGVDVEVVDESGRPLPNGEPGWLRVKSDFMVDGYLDDLETTRRFFRDGWFYPGDTAVLDGPRRLKVIGRGDEMITTGGGKYAPSDLEALVMARLGEGDVGICMFADKDGIEYVHVAIAGARVGDQELLALVTQAFRTVAIGKFVVVVTEAIPRNAAGKIQRARLKEAIVKQLNRS
jgi:acyl-CoA synthetase (AMP-forming)/AMP-acid ligase II